MGRDARVLVCGVVVLVVGAAACGSSSSGDSQDSKGGSAGMTTGGSAGSSTGGSAAAAAGGSAASSTGASSGVSFGGTSGVGGTTTCPAPVPLHPDACFEPCGGSPIGRWVLEETCVRDPVGFISGCSSHFTVTGTPDFRMDFREGGALTVSGREQFSFDFRLDCGSSVCPSVIDEPGLMTFTDQGTNIFCDAEPGGCCRCEGFSIGYDDTRTATWQVQDSFLTLTAIPPLDFCVTGNEMWLGHVEEGMSYRLRKVECYGSPTPCDMRSVEECPTNERCTVGRCEGGTTCDGLSEATCATASGCSWDPMTCSGDAGGVCVFEQCGEEPGCDFVDPDRACQGTAEACTMRDTTTCAYAPGCGLGTCASSTGADTRPCGAVSIALCQFVSGCIATSEGCIGTTECSAQTADYSCEAAACNWTPSASCVGAATPCAELDASRCGAQPGCTLAP